MIAPLWTTLSKRIKGRLRRWQSRRDLENFRKSKREIDLSALEDWERSLTDPTKYYQDCSWCFFNKLPLNLRQHRDYFTQDRRGFGEDAFHVMWFLIFERFHPKKILEIGVYRGQTLSLFALLQRQHSIHGEIVGISPFLPAGDAVSSYRSDIDYLTDTLANFRHFSLPEPELVKAFSTDGQAKERISRTTWDAIYIDGNHDYDVALQDWQICAANIRVGGLIVLDDSGLSTNFQPLLFATAGHPGPSKLAQEIDPRDFREILQVGHNRVFQKIERAE